MDDRAPIRPTSEKAREALFSSLGTVYIAGSFLDVFAGSGAMGLEALSRGAERVTAVESNRRSAQLIRRNLAVLGVGSDRYRLLVADFRKALASLSGEKFDCIFADPPYDGHYGTNVIELVAERLLLAREGVLVIESFHREVMPDSCQGLCLFKTRKYGQSVLSYYRHGEG